MAWLKMGEACKKANRSRKVMRQWCRDGIVKARRIPAGSRFDWQVDSESLDNLDADSAVRARALAHLRIHGL